MRPMSKATKEYNDLSRELDMYQELTRFLVNGIPSDAEEIVTVKEDEGPDTTYTFTLYGCLRAHAGIVVEAYRHTGQSAFVTVRYFDKWFALVDGVPYYGGLWTEIKGAASRLHRARDRIFEQASK